MRTAKTLIRLGGSPGWSESSLGAHAILLVLSRGGSYILPHWLWLTWIELCEIIWRIVKPNSKNNNSTLIRSCFTAGACREPVHLQKNNLEKCSPHKGFDYFAGSEATYIILWVSFGLIPFRKLLFNCLNWFNFHNQNIAFRLPKTTGFLFSIYCCLSSLKFLWYKT